MMRMTMEAQPIQKRASKSFVPSRWPLMTKTAETASAKADNAIAKRRPPNWYAWYPVSAIAPQPASAGIIRITNSEDPNSEVNSRVTAGMNGGMRSEEHTSELQSLRHLVCRLL